MHPTANTFVALRILFYCTLKEKKWLHYQEHQLVQRTKRGNSSNYMNTKRNEENHHIESEFKETFDNNCDTGSSAEQKLSQFLTLLRMVMLMMKTHWMIFSMILI